MTTFIVRIAQPVFSKRNRKNPKVAFTKMAVTTMLASDAIAAVKNFYPAGVRGWGDGSTFEVVKETSPNTPFFTF
jgi:endonuclease YncB( thermonuclease family)